MEKKTKKVGGVAAAATAVAGAATAAAVLTGKESSEEVAMAEPIGTDEDIVDGGILPDVEVTGSAQILDGGTLTDIEVLGNITEEGMETAEETQYIVTPQEDVAEATTITEEPAAAAEPVAVAAAELVAVAEPIAAAEPLPVSEPIIAAPEPIATEEEEEFADFDEDPSANNLVSMKEGSVMDDLSDAIHRVGENLGILPTEEDSMSDFINNADASEFMKL